MYMYSKFFGGGGGGGGGFFSVTLLNFNKHPIF